MSQSALKIIAMLTMLIDHIGVLLFPDVAIFRIVGRIAFPIFAYLIAEGCKYSKNKAKYLTRVLICAAVFQIVRFVIDKTLMPSVVWGYALVILFAMLMNWARPKWNTRFIAPTMFAIITSILTLVCKWEYLFFPLLIGIAVYLIQKPWLKWLSLCALLICLGLTSEYQLWGLLALPILMLYNGTRGSIKFKYTLYLFYPLHYIILGVIKYVCFA
jgi:hypothetical protein